MRKAVNENQAVQIALVGVLVVVAGFLFMTRIAGGGEEAAPPATPATAPPTGETTAAATAPPADAAGAVETAPSAEAIGSGGEGFVAGPGLPKPVAAAYENGRTVVLLVVRERGIDDGKVEAAVRKASGVDAAVFVTHAKGIAEYSRIAQGVNVDHVPALVVVQPKKLAEGPLPEATISYGYRGPQTVAQAIRDAGYKGPDALPYYPN